ncbi:hypothetical protein ASPZODRAFT_61894 [Penicilliopsis zonata CBS 506.65]|uniref:chitin deacetylase n=1 Tax=Penicilliopsis zonata CBS 506.65 TaxID=1073090 RepID=A0A1L9SNB1_9EURO|nr:hypothetical protein ASPZODRAFT_61894 [Penicilliopsis zonata CBS 506.65]OJJ48749.1 hypothetical protein ASPZODRAFT_61894 [Penicilliopsis zonata CBS 506.65]
MSSSDVYNRALWLLIAIMGSLILTLYVVYKPPAFLVRYFQRRWPDVLWEVPTRKKVVALTIDDAPSEYTSDILAILRAHQVTATFFVIGSQIVGREEVLRRAVREANELGNHAMEDEPSRSLSNPVLQEQVLDVQQRIREIYRDVDLNPPLNLFRPGSGFFSTRMRQLLAGLDYRLVLGGIYPHDAQIPYWKVNAYHVLSMLRPGAIIICHDRRSWTAPMLRHVIPEIQRQGYRIVTVSELLLQQD